MDAADETAMAGKRSGTAKETGAEGEATDKTAAAAAGGPSNVSSISIGGCIDEKMGAGGGSGAG